MGSTLTFSYRSQQGQFGPRWGDISLKRRDGTSVDNIETPGLITLTSRGVVPHLSRDHVDATESIRWTHIPFESFLERIPPVPTLVGGPNPLHTFLGYRTNRHILSLAVRDPNDSREIPPNTREGISTWTIRGVRKMTPDAWRSYTLQCKPDIVLALSDAVQIQGPQSQKRLTKSLERSTAWLAHLLGPVDPTTSPDPGNTHPLNVFVTMAGGAELRAREAFSSTLVEELLGKDLQQVQPLKTLDEGLAGYAFELHTIRPKPTGVADTVIVDGHSDCSAGLAELMKGSLRPLPKEKPRIAYSCVSPHEVLHLIRDIGVDLFDAHWAQRAADIGVALDFSFPVAPHHEEYPGLPIRRSNGKYDLGHNLFSTSYAHDHVKLASSPLYPSITSETSSEPPNCPCAACSPTAPASHVVHSDYEKQHPTLLPSNGEKGSPYMRSYIHHLLHTHEMSSHSLLMMHNLSVVQAFFAGIRNTVAKISPSKSFSEEVELFRSTYSEPMELFREAEVEWARVESERGKGRLSREKGQQ